MAIILRVGYEEFLIDNVKDAQAVIAGLSNAKPVDEIDYTNKKDFAKQFGTTYFFKPAEEKIASIKINKSCPVTAEKYEWYLKNLEQKEETARAAPGNRDPEKAAIHLQKLKEVVS